MESKERDLYRRKLADSQMAIKDSKLPVIVILEGWGAAGKGSAISGIIKSMDPRFFRVYNMDSYSLDELRKPFLYRHAARMPQAGQFSFFDGGYMSEISEAYVAGVIDEEEFRDKIESVNRYERSLVDNGYLIVKFFLDIDKDTQRERFEALLDNKNTAWRVSEDDLWQNKKYHKFERAFKEFMTATDTEQSPWHRIEAHDKYEVERFIASTIVSSIESRIKVTLISAPTDSGFEMCPVTPPSKTLLEGKKLSEEEYREKLKDLQKRLGKLSYKLYRKKIPVIIGYEGWDAAGKGGNIKRVASDLDPRGYEVFPIASPSAEEKSRHYLWRFWNRIPKSGHIAIFDRTWYGRVMVERLEGFCSEADWKRAYNEINEFEKELYDWGAIIVKFWVQIDKDTQLQRFTIRQNTPEKQWKITDEDWRNREKWDLYEGAVDEMIEKTSTAHAPWYILESNDKKYARIKALETLVEVIETRLSEIKTYKKELKQLKKEKKKHKDLEG